MDHLYFIGGAHGVGKTTLAHEIAKSVGAVALSSGALIRQEMAVEPSMDKRVRDIPGNQALLIQALSKHRPLSTAIVLDGHYCLQHASGRNEPVPYAIFEAIRPTLLFLLRADAAQVVERLFKRDARKYSVDVVRELDSCELDHATSIAERLGSSLVVLQGLDAARIAIDRIRELEDQGAL